MRILQIGKFSRRYAGGVERAFFCLGAQLARTLHVEGVVCGPAARGELDQGGGFPCHLLPSWFTAFSTPICPSLIPFLRRARDFDVVQIVYQNPMAALAYWLARPKGKLVVWYQHDIVRHAWVGRLLGPLLSGLLRKADAIVVASRAYAESSPMLRPFLGKIAVIPMGIELEPFEEESEAALGRELRKQFRGPLILYLGRLVYYKGLERLIEAMKGLDAELLLVGSGPLEGRLRALAQSEGVASKVHFRRCPPDEPTARYFHACDVFVLPSNGRTEAFGLVLLEAMACGKPVVATELGTGTSFICQDGATGKVVPPDDPEALREALWAILSDRDLAARLGKAGRARVRELFTARAMAESFLGLYRGLLGRGQFC